MDEERPKQESDCKVKERLTSHWDWDAMPRAELEALVRQGRRRQQWRRAQWLGGGALVAVRALVCRHLPGLTTHIRFSSPGKLDPASLICPASRKSC